MAALTPEEISQILEEFFATVGTRQYIGARYVPIFGRRGEESIAWDNTAPYEPLTIVLHQGNSYTSRQYVPAGVEITNQAYWALTGNYNAQVEAYRAEVQQIADEIDGVEETASQALERAQAASDAVTELSGTVTTLSDTVTDEIEPQIGDLREALGDLSDIVECDAAGQTVTPIYVGDFITTQVFQAACVHNGIAYMAVADTDDSNTKVKAANLSANTFLWERSFTQFGHANSMCFDETRGVFHVCGTGQMYDVNEAFTAATPSSLWPASASEAATRITYDHETGYLWALSGLMATHVPTWQLWYCSPDMDEFAPFAGSLDTSSNPVQDIAAYNDVIVAMGTNRMGVAHKVDRDAGTCVACSTLYLANRDLSDRYLLDESEGIEFDETGVLYQSFNARHTASLVNDATLCCIPFRTKFAAPQDRNKFRAVVLTISSETQQKFHNSASELKSLSQLATYNMSTIRTVQYNGTVSDPFPAIIQGDVNVNIGGTVTLGHIEVDRGQFALYTASGSQLTFDTTEAHCIHALNAACILRFAIVGAIIMPGTATNFVNVGTNAVPIFVGIFNPTTLGSNYASPFEAYTLYLRDHKVSMVSA